MCSPLAKNSKIDIKTLHGGLPNYLLVDENQRPIEGQTPKTDQVLQITGQAYNDIITGTDNCTIAANLAGGNATINFTAAGLEGISGMFGREIGITVIPTNAGGVRSVTFVLPANYFFSYQGAAVPLVNGRVTVPVTVVSEFSLVFHDPSVANQGNMVSVKGDVTGYTFAP